MTVLTPTVRSAARRWRFWAAFAVIAIVVALVTFIGAGANRPLGVPLDPASPGPVGAKALAQVLGEQGVEVTITASLDDTRAAVGSDAATVVVHDLSGIVDAGLARELGRLGTHLVLLDPDMTILDALAPDVAMAGAVVGPVEADCEVGAAQRAGTITGDGVGFRHLGDDPTVRTCFDSGDDIVSLVQLADGERTTSLLGATDALSNEHIGARGNAAFALGLLGEHDRLVWYVPGVDDAPEAGAAEFTPGWVTPVMVLLILVVIAAGLAQGRRLGPLVVENLPVTVRATETMEGRARLYQHSSARLRALDSLRIGTVQRLASIVRLPRTASVEEVAGIVAEATGTQPREVLGLLVETIPQNDRELVELSDRLLELERAVTAATTP